MAEAASVEVIQDQVHVTEVIYGVKQKQLAGYAWIINSMKKITWNLNHYPAYFLLKKISNKNNQKVIPLDIQPHQIQQELQQNQLQPIQQEQQNKHKLNFYPNLVQINQQQMDISLSNQSDYVIQSLIPHDQLQQSFYQQPDSSQVPIHIKHGQTFQQDDLQKDDNSVKSCKL
ncbi:hypothetical protein TTHERM_00083880 (macronuclear) [Tetrahymena thermophila SB210]|uniref:Uncharacterized protein n=1 Tax=Tetrahymena thermophila (strain SB210) TaxID=312017 RepID=Q236W1_TETTS|nr:hypothetical protein TTHERM_00083880 [Tetrahymena thermophila SB210]EAR92389.2 hypothetical protein TTHERM_00083880 [Tetrahymena thermophila SB210]|eukprot:XP_001012634.2 hypothetical protein TTHERM_00083880 [Tetrahymena thermophila SB210]